MTFRPLGTPARTARSEVRRVLNEWGVQEGTAEVIELVTSELATNALRVCRRDNVVHIQLSTQDSGVLLEVSDPSQETLREVVAGPDDEHGRGLLLVRELSQEFGVTDRPIIGKTIYAQFALPSCEGDVL